MCICINCFYFKNCSIYNFIKKNYKFNISEDSLINESNLEINPKQSILKFENKIDQKFALVFLKEIDVNECTNYLEYPGEWKKNLKNKI